MGRCQGRLAESSAFQLCFNLEVILEPWLQIVDCHTFWICCLLSVCLWITETGHNVAPNLTSRCFPGKRHRTNADIGNLDISWRNGLCKTWKTNKHFPVACYLLVVSVFNFKRGIDIKLWSMFNSADRYRCSFVCFPSVILMILKVYCVPGQRFQMSTFVCDLILQE